MILLVMKLQKKFQSILSFENEIFKIRGVQDIKLNSSQKGKKSESRKIVKVNQPLITKFLKK